MPTKPERKRYRFKIEKPGQLLVTFVHTIANHCEPSPFIKSNIEHHREGESWERQQSGACPFDKACCSTIADVALLYSSWQGVDSTSRTIYCLLQQHRAGSPWCDWIEACSKNQRTALIATDFLDQWEKSLVTTYRHPPRYPYFGEPLKSSLLTVSWWCNINFLPRCFWTN